MARDRRRFERPLGERRYRKMFVIAVEGVRTEPQYFGVFNGAPSIVRVHCIPGSSASAPTRVLKRMREHLRKEGLLPTDEAWLVVDKDQWTEPQLAELFAWSQEADNHGFALSNPQFEFWLLLHFDDGAGASSPTQCVARLRQHLPDYDKGIAAAAFTRERIADALATDLLRLPLAKAMDLGTPRGFDRAVASLAAELRRQAGRSERDAVRAAVNVLDVDWRTTTPEQRRRLVAEAMNAAALATAVIPARIQATLGPAAEAVVAATRSHARAAPPTTSRSPPRAAPSALTRSSSSTRRVRQCSPSTSRAGRTAWSKCRA